MENKVTIYGKSGKGFKDSFWYDGEIARKGEYTLFATGEIKVATPEGDIYNDSQALEYALDNKWTDKDLGKFEFLMNNWFEIVDDNNETVEMPEDYDDGIKMLRELK